MQSTIQSLQLAYHESYPHIEVVESLKTVEQRLDEQRLLNYIIYGVFLLFFISLSMLLIRSNKARIKEIAEIRKSKREPEFDRNFPKISKLRHEMEEVLHRFEQVIDNADARHSESTMGTNQLASVALSRSTEKTKPKTLFLAQPDENGIFNNASSTEFIGGKSLYVFEFAGNKQAYFRLYEHHQVTIRALKMASRVIAPACASENALSPNHSDIKTLKDGTAEKLPDGKWKVKTKARIRYV